MIVHGFHGTTLDRAESIKHHGFDKSIRQGLWLGTGIYFFQDAPGHAQLWAEFIAKKRDSKPAVVEAKISLENLLDLSDIYAWEFIKKVHAKYKHALEQPQQIGIYEYLDPNTDYDPQKIGRNYVDHKLMDKALEQMKTKRNINCVRAPIAEGFPIHSTSWLWDRSAIMLSVLAKSSILEKIVHEV